MRLNLKFELDKQFIEVEYRKMFISYLKYCLSDVDEKYFEQYYGNTDKKMFSFAVYLKDFKKNGDFFEISTNEISMNISFYDEMQGYIYYAAILRQLNKPFRIKNNQMKLISINKINEKQIESDCVFIKTLSPLCFLHHDHEMRDNKKDYYYSIIDSNFEEVMKEKTDVIIKPIHCKKVLIRHYGIDIPCTLGTFIIAGPKEKLNKLYKSGIGDKTGQGFGMIEVV